MSANSEEQSPNNNLPPKKDTVFDSFTEDIAMFCIQMNQRSDAYVNESEDKDENQEVAKDGDANQEVAKISELAEDLD